MGEGEENKRMIPPRPRVIDELDIRRYKTHSRHIGLVSMSIVPRRRVIAERPQ